MERVGSKEPNVIRAYVDDAFREIEGLIPERTTYKLYNIVADQKIYARPNNMTKILGVYRKYRENSTGNYTYILIPRVTNIDLTEPMSATAADAEVDIIVV
jgi:hypothetical protein